MRAFNDGTSAIIGPGKEMQIIRVDPEDTCDFAPRGASLALTLFLEELNANPGGISGPIIQRPVAIVRYGTKSVMAQFECDYVTGNTLPMGAAGIVVSCRNEAPAPDPASRPVKAGAFAIVGSNNRNPRLNRTFYVDAPIIVGGNVLFTVPPFGGEFKLLRQPTATTAFRLSFITRAGATVYDTDVAAGQPCPAVEIANDIAIVTVVNTGAAVIQGARGLFALNL